MQGYYCPQRIIYSIMAKIKFTQQPKQRFPGDRKWKNEDAPKADNKKAKGQ